MCQPIAKQLLQINLGYEVLIEQFIKNMMDFPGCWLNVPLPIFKGQSNEMYKEEKKLICARTSEILSIMGIKHRESNEQYQMMVEVDDDTQSTKT